MRGREYAAVLVLFACGVCGCASAPPTPKDWLPDPSEVPSSPWGGWIEITLIKPHDEVVIDGELLAIENQSVYVLRGDAIRSVPIDSVGEARVVYYDSHAGEIAAGTVIGTVATISNGALLILTAPMWIVGGSVATNARAGEPILEASDDGWDGIVPYARFPQGLPPDFVPRAAPPVVEPVVHEPEPPVVEPVVHEPEPPVAQPRAIDWERAKAGFCMGLGVTRAESASGPGVILGLNVGKKWVTGGVRFSWGDPSYEFLEDTTVLDLGLLLGVRFRYRSLQAAVRAGPAAWGFTIGDLADFDGSLAVQGELFVYFSRSTGLGAVVAWNENDTVDFYTVTLGFATGPR
jgi:hypothetical protein